MMFRHSPFRLTQEHRLCRAVFNPEQEPSVEAKKVENKDGNAQNKEKPEQQKSTTETKEVNSDALEKRTTELIQKADKDTAAMRKKLETADAKVATMRQTVETESQEQFQKRVAKNSDIDEALGSDFVESSKTKVEPKAAQMKTEAATAAVEKDAGKQAEKGVADTEANKIAQDLSVQEVQKSQKA